MELPIILLLIGAASPILYISIMYFQNWRHSKLPLEEQRKMLHERIENLKAERTWLDREISTAKSIEALLGSIQKMRT